MTLRPPPSVEGEAPTFSTACSGGVIPVLGMLVITPIHAVAELTAIATLVKEMAIEISTPTTQRITPSLRVFPIRPPILTTF